MLEYFRMVTSGILPEGYSKDKKNRQAASTAGEGHGTVLYSTDRRFLYNTIIYFSEALGRILLESDLVSNRTS